MKFKPETLIVSVGDRETIIPIKSKYTFLRGDSGTGKSVLLRDLLLNLRNNPHGIKFRYPLRQMELTLEGLKFGLEETYKNNRITLFFGDEDLKYCRGPEFASIVANSPHLFLMTIREPLQNLPYAIGDMLRLETVGHKNIGVPLKSPVNSSLSAIKHICTEDSKSGYEFFKKFFDGTDIDVVSAHGRNNIENLMNSMGSTLFIADGLGLGPVASNLLLALEIGAKNNKLLVIDSFEHLLYTSKLCKGTEQPSINCPNKEDFFEDALADLLNQNGIKYTKGKLPLCFTEDCCPIKRCRLYTPGDKYGIILEEAHKGLMEFRATHLLAKT